MEFVSFVPDYWDGPRHNRHYFCLELAKHHKVLFVSPPFSIERILRRTYRRNLPASQTRQVAKNLWAHVPSKFLFTSFRFPRLNSFLRRIRLFLLRRTLARHGFRSPILLIWHPQYLDMLDEFPGVPCIYYIYDHLSGYTGSDPTQRSRSELELIRRADLVFVLSRKLLELNQSFNSNIVLLPNAVDFEHFSRARNAETEIPDDLLSIPRPRVGYIGSINEKVDIELLQEIADNRPAFSVVLIGRQNFQSDDGRLGFSQLVDRPNVYWIPYRDPNVLPAYLKGLDVCLMCYVINGWTYYGDPSKMHEYLAAGKPTVGTPLPAIAEYQDVIEVPSQSSEWITAIDRCLLDIGADAIARRVDVARSNSYEERVRYALSIIEERLCPKGFS